MEEQEEEEEKQEGGEKGYNSIDDFQLPKQVEEEQKEVDVVDVEGNSSDDFQGEAKRRRKRIAPLPKIPKRKTTPGDDSAEGVSDLLLPSCVSSILS
jgi:hypothetical protein